MKRRCTTQAGIAVLAALLPVAPVAAEGWDAARFDPPANTQTVTTEEGKRITCTTYRDLMVRESEADTPAPDDATLLPFANGTAPACGSVPGPGARVLATAGKLFLGRTGGFLVFEQAAYEGIVPFAVLDAATGRALIEDVTADAGVKSFAFVDGTLRLDFYRGVLGDCSIPKQGASCWAGIALSQKLPPAVAGLPAPLKACAAAYRTGKAPKDVRSIISFPVRLTWNGQQTVEARGPLRCTASP